MATSIIKQQNIKLEVLWNNPNSMVMPSNDLYLNPSGIPKLIIVNFRIYANESGGVYLTTAVYYNTSLSFGNLVTSVRYDGSNNFIVMRQTNYDFSNNKFTWQIGYRQDTYKASVGDDKCLIPVQIVAVY